ncbi:hypothetical protein GGF32_008069 [Allomyces javanicus]|nr:hypothetical protein GGF32_008069 [Allomyces javanicus]
MFPCPWPRTARSSALRFATSCPTRAWPITCTAVAVPSLISVRHLASRPKRARLWEKKAFRPKEFKPVLDFGHATPPKPVVDLFARTEDEQGPATQDNDWLSTGAAPLVPKIQFTPIDQELPRGEGATLVIGNVVWSAQPEDVVRLLQQVPGLLAGHIDYLIQGRTDLSLNPTGKWLVKLSRDTPVTAAEVRHALFQVSLTGQVPEVYTRPPKHEGAAQWEAEFIHPKIGNASGRTLLVTNLPSVFTHEDLFLTFRSFNVVPERPNAPPPVEILGAHANASIARAIVRVETAADASQAARERQNKLVVPRFAKVGGLAPSRIQCTILHNIVPLRRMPSIVESARAHLNELQNAALESEDDELVQSV